MNREEAQQILSGYRPGTEDASDPYFKDALEAVKNDSELEIWFEQQMQFDRSMRAALSNVPVPNELRGSIQTAVHESLESSKKVSRMPLAGYLLPIAAIVIAMIFISKSLIPDSGPREEPVRFLTQNSTLTWQESMAQYFNPENPGFIRAASSFSEVKSFFASLDSGGFPSFQPKIDPSDTSVIGCQAILWNNHKVALTCMYFENSEVHLFVIDQAGFASASLSQPDFKIFQFNQDHAVQTVSWTDGNSSFLLLTDEDHEGILQRFLSRSAEVEDLAVASMSHSLI